MRFVFSSKSSDLSMWCRLNRKSERHTRTLLTLSFLLTFHLAALSFACETMHMVKYP